mgnify:CR=1 FL=1
MVQEIKHHIMQDFDDICFNLKDWDSVLTTSSDVLVFHQKSLIDYYAAYFKGENLSIVLYDHKKAVGVLPLFIYKSHGNWIISGNYEGLTKPLFVNGVARKAKKRIENKIVSIVYSISNKLEIKKLTIFDSNMALSSWYLLWLDRANNIFITHHMAIDLQLSIDIIKLGFRKSYKPLVNKAMREWDIVVCEGNIDDVFEEFRLLHLEVAGVETRCKESWDIQKEQIKNKEAFLVTVRDGALLIGAGLFNYTKDMGVYSSGAYKRELFHKPIGHGVQMKAIEALKDKGCKIYYIGQKMIPIDETTPSEKELSISHFKEGFAGYVFTQPHLKVIISE